MVAGGPGWIQPTVPRPTRTPYLPRGTWLPLSLLTALALSYPQSEPTQGLCPPSGGPLHTVPAQPQPGGPFMTLPLKAQRWGICSQKVEGWSCSCAVAVGPPGGRAKGQFSTCLPSNLRGRPCLRATAPVPAAVSPWQLPGPLACPPSRETKTRQVGTCPWTTAPRGAQPLMCHDSPPGDTHTPSPGSPAQALPASPTPVPAG